jgi:hypothetical protein
MTSIRRSTTALLAGFGLLLATRVSAGLLDSPPPSFGGPPGKVVYRMGPVHFDPGAVDTVVTCTNNGDVDANVAFEVYDDSDQLTGLVTRATAAPNATVTFATSSAAGVAAASLVLGLHPLEDGKARVSATTTKLSCSGKTLIKASGGETREAPLELVKKVAFGD